MAIRRSGQQATRNLDRGFLQRLRKAQRNHKRCLLLENLEGRNLMATGPVLLGVQPNEGDVLANGQIRNVAPKHLTFRFNEGQVLDAATLMNGIKLTRAGLDGVLGNANDVVITPGAIVVNDNQNEVIMRFAEPLVDDLYRIDLIGSGPTPLRNTLGDAYNNGVNTSLSFELDLGALVSAIVPQPIVRTAGGQLQWGVTERSQIEVYFNSDELDLLSAQNPAFYQLHFTGAGQGTATNTDDVVYLPTSAVYTPAQNKVLLTFAQPLDQLGSGPGTFRLRIGSNETKPPAPTQQNVTTDPGSSYGSALNIGPLTGNQSQILSSIIDPQAYALQFPGGNTMPGNRDVYTYLGNPTIAEGNDQTIDRAIDSLTPDTTSGPTVMKYNFKTTLGFQNPTSPYLNSITDAQKQRTREIFEIFSRVAGIQFIETENEGITVATGDLRVGRGDILTGDGGVKGEYFRLADGTQLVIMDGGELDWNDSFGGNWFQEAMKEIGRAVGLQYSYDMPAGTIMGSNPNGLTTNSPVEQVFPGDQDIVNLQRLYRPDSIDIDLYRFNVTEAGTFYAETIAERLGAPSLLNTNLNLYKEDGAGKRTLISRNDDYFSKDSYLELHLEPGTYYIGVSASGNNQYDPTITDTGIGGKSAGAYDLKINFKPDLAQASQLVDKDRKVAFDGDSDGTPGGVYNFWFRTQTVTTSAATNNVLIVDKNATTTGNGTLASPFRFIKDALTAAQPGQIVRIVGNGGTDNNLATIGNNRPYEIGFNTFGQALPDGDSLTVPKGVTVMVDAGAILKFRRAAVVVGSTSATVDKSGSAFQLLGKPGTPVHMTSWGDQATGIDTDPLPSTPAQGDWGGILYRNDIDNAGGRFNYENEGIFLNYVNNTLFQYGGGSVVIGSVPQTVTPVHMVDARPEVSWNTIRFSAVAGLSANPNSFEETNFNDPRYQSTAYTADYDRVGPDIHRNTLVNNTLNGLLVRVIVAANGTFDGLTVAGRFDDSDIVHIVQNTLQIRGTAGGPVQDSNGDLHSRLDARLAIDKNIVVKLDSARIEALMGGQLIVEATPGNEAIFTSILDATYGAGGTFSTSTSPSQIPAQAGDWAGVYIGPYASASIDNAVFQFGGGVSTVEGTFTAFNVLEINQSTVRVTDSLFRNNADGTGGAAPADRFGRGFNNGAAIHVRGAQPIIMANTFRGNGGSVIHINANALNGFLNADYGRSTGLTELNPLYGDNQGPLVRLNRLADNDLNGMEVRGGVLTTESTWDDTDIVHILKEEIVVPDFHNYGGLTLRSNPTESLVVKSEGATAGITANGTELDIADRIGGRLSVIGLPGFPVVMTSLSDDTVGAGFMPNGQPQVDTNGDSKGGQGLLPTIGEVDRGTLIDNDVAAGVPGQFAFQVDVGGASGFAVNNGTGGGITAQGRNQLFVNEDVIFEFLNYIDIGPAGSAFELRATTITQQPTLVTPDHVVSRGTFQGANGLVRWQVDSYLLNGEARVYNELTLESDADFGEMQFINYLDEDVLGVSDDILYLTGTPGQDDFRAYTLDDAERIGFAQGGIFNASNGLINATYTGFAADEFSNLRFAIQGAGTTYTPAGNINLTNLPAFNDPELGTVYGQADITTAFAWTVSPTARNAKITSFLDLVATNPGKRAGAGDWRGLKIGEFANDRNVITVQESEPSTSIAPGINAIPDRAQLVGHIAPNEKAGDENRRLGFQVHGYLSQVNDVDVYSFKADSGTQVWLDMDRTTQSLDAVLELVDVNGVVIARSDNSEAEGDQLESLYKYDRSIRVNGLQKTSTFVDDLYTLNPRDPGMAVVLPGPAGTTNTYYVRVRSAPVPTALNDNPVGGLTSGAYQFQIRLSEVDEVPGTTVRYADIRYATTGIQVLGQPTHSPLTGETAEVESGDTRANSQYVGNMGTSDRGAIAISGALANGNDIDWYSFDVEYEGIENIPGHTDLTPEHYSTVIDLDFADGIGRGNFSVYVYNAAGTLVYMGQDSSIASDRPTPATSVTQYDGARGTFGTKDASIGPVELPEGRYFIAIASAQQIPSVLQQNFVNAIAEEQKIISREPVNSSLRVSEDHLTLDPFGNRVAETTTAGFSKTPILFDRATDTVRGTYDSIVPYTLGDLTMFMSSRGGGGQTNLNTTDPFTGNIKTVMSGNGAGFDYEDMLITADGRILAYNNRTIEGLLPTNDANSGHLLLIDPVTGAQTDLGDDGVDTFFIDPASNPPASVRAFGLSTGAQDGNGVHANAITTHYSDALGEIGLYIGNRGDVNNPPNGVTTPRNIMFRFDLNTGAVINWNFAPDRVSPGNGFGPGTQKVPANIFNSGNGMANDQENITGATYVGGVGTAAPGNMANNGPLYFSTDQGRIYRLPQLTGNVFPLNNGQPYRDPVTNAVLNFTNIAKTPNRVEYNGQVGPTGLDRVVIASTANAMYAINVDTGALQRIFFDGRTFVPITPQNFALAGRQAVSGGTTNGIVFTALSANPWGFRGERLPTPDLGPGIPTGHDGSTVNTRQTNNIAFRFDGPTPGDKSGSLMSLPFSLEGYSASDKPYMYLDYSLFSSDVNHNGGSQFARDSVRIYIGTPDGDWKIAATNNDYRNWNQFAPFTQNDEFDYDDRVQSLFDRTNTIAGGSVDNNFNWRQVRVSLDDFAGMKDLRIRVEAARSGTSYVNDSRYTGYEVKVKAGRDLRDGEQVVIQNGLNTDVFEIDLGTTLVLPSGGVIADGETVTLSVGNPVFTRTYEFDRGGGVAGGNIAVPITPNMESDDVAASLLAAINGEPAAAARFAPHLNGNRLNLRGDAASNFDVVPTIAIPPGAPESLIKRDGAAGVSAGARPMVIHAGLEAVTPATEVFGPTSSVREVFRQALADAYTINLADSTRQTSDLHAFRAFNDFVRITMKEVVSSGPFGMNKGSFLEGAEYGENNNNYGNPNTQTSAFTGDNNNFEGMYIDDIYIGFAERGERITQAQAQNDTFVANNLTINNQRLNWDESNSLFPTQIVNQVSSGPYRVEIRQGSNYGEPLERLYNPETLVLNRQFDTNEVHGAASTLVMPHGSVIPEGATIRVGDGLNAITLEFEDISRSDGVRPGNVAVPYSPQAPASVIAAQIRDTLNSAAVRNVVNLAAGLSDGADGTGIAIFTPSEGTQSPNNDVYNALTFPSAPNAVDARTLSDFTTSNARIGDNPSKIGANASRDVDLYVFNARAGVPVQFRVDSQTIGSALNPLIRIFDPATGTQIALDDNSGPGNDALLNFTPQLTQTYIIGISASGNNNYTIFDSSSGSAGGSTGNYRLTSLGLGSTSNLVNIFAPNLLLTGTLNEQGLPLDSASVRINTQAFRDQSGQTNDTRDSSIPITLPTFHGTGRIGDNSATTAGRDVDMFNFTAKAGDVISIEVTGEHNQSLGPVVRVFDASGAQQGVNATPNPLFGTSERTIFDFAVPADGTYFIGVSGAGYDNYDSEIANSGTPANLQGSLGIYSIKVWNAAHPSAVGAVPTDALGDSKGDTNDTRATAINSNGNISYTATALIGDNANPGPGGDLDVYSFGARFGDVFRIRVDKTADSDLDPTFRVLDATGAEVSGAGVLDADGIGGFFFTPPQANFGGANNAVFYIEVSGLGGTTGGYRLQYRNLNVANVLRTINYNEVDDTTKVKDFFDPDVSTTLLERRDMKGDSNLEREQGQIVIEANRISNSLLWGLEFDAGARTEGSLTPHQGSASVLRELNVGNQAPGVVAVNNVIFGNLEGGIRVSGVTNLAGEPVGAVPFARIVNNTIYGVGGTLANGGSDDDGILVDHNAAPTLLNNIVANFARGINVSADSQSTVVGGTLYKGNVTNSNFGLGASPITLSNNEPLFINAGLGNFYLAEGSKAIDSSVDSLADRAALVTVRNPLGIPLSPILAPDLDATGQARVPASPTANVFRDRGAIDRSDFSGPTASIINPLDNDAAGVDIDARQAVVRVPADTVLTNFIIQIFDSTDLNNPVQGTGVDPTTVDPSKVQVFRDGELLVAGEHYSFSFSSTNKQIRLTPLQGVWPQNSAYVIKLDNSVATGIKDLANNPLQPNALTGETIFQIFIGNGFDYGDAPAPYPTTITDGGARHSYDPNVRLGNSVNPKANGLPSIGAVADVDDDGVTFDRTLIPGGFGIVTVTPSVDGNLSAWIDWNQDGDWNDVGEEIFSNRAVTAGSNTLNFNIAVGAVLGNTYARFRFSTDTISGPAGIDPNGNEPDGEVEDYQVTVSKSSWQNPNGGKYGNLNVSDDYLANGQPRITAFDVLLIISKLNLENSVAFFLPDPPTPDFAPPPFYDVDGNGVITPEDARIILDFLDAPPADAGGEAGSGTFAFSFGGSSRGESSVLDVGMAAGEGESTVPASTGSVSTSPAIGGVATGVPAARNVVSPLRATAAPVRRAETSTLPAVAQTGFSGQSASDFDALLSVIAGGSGKKKTNADAADSIFGDMA
jgi:hypothetical protein